MHADKSRKLLRSMSFEDRIKLAGEKVGQMYKHITNLMQTHANNEIILFTDTLSSQVGKSYAAHAFKDFQGVMYFGEIARVIALWDELNLEKCSFPTIIE